MTKTLLVNRDHPGITIVSLNRPDHRNALTIQLMQEVIDVVRETNEQENQRVLIFRGEGASFCTGLDLYEAGDLTVAEESAHTIAQMYLEIYTSSVITLASVHGHAIAGGAGLSSVCDYVIADENAKFGFPEVRRGLIPAIVLTFLKSQLKERDLRELFLFGNLISAEKAKQIGLINQVLPSEMLEEECLSIAKKALTGGPGAVAHLKRLIDHFTLRGFQEDLEHSLTLHKMARTHAEAQEGIRAFIEKRNPSWYPDEV